MPMYWLVSSMNRLSLFAILSVAGIGLQAQTTLSTMTISTSPSGARFSVDGTVYNQAVTLTWPAGSEHLVVFITDPTRPGEPVNTVVQTAPQGDTQYIFKGWVDNLTLTQPTTDPVQTVTADPSITSLTAQLTIGYRLQLNFFSAPGPLLPPTCGAPGAIPAGQFRPGIVFIANQCYWASANIFVQAGTTVALNAYPYPGFVFIDWASNVSAPNAYLTSYVMNGPIILAPRFSPAKRVTFLTSPLQLEVSIDHTTVPTRRLASLCDDPQPVVSLTGFPPLCYGDFDFAPGSTHTIAGVSPQRDGSGNWWVFDHWSDGIAQNGIYTTDNNVSSPDVVTGLFVRGAQVGFQTTPTGLPLNVDGRVNWPNYNFVWAQNSTHTVSAASTQSDASGRQYTFQGWSNSGAASQTITVDQNAVSNGLRLTAVYSELSRIVVQSSPPGLILQVDGSTCQTPCNIDRNNGVQVNVSAPATISMGTGARLDFSSWSDGGAASHALTVNQNYTTLTASFQAKYQLSAAADPANGVIFHFSPASADMFFGQNTQVTVNATANPGFTFLRWNGALSGAYPSGVVTMTAPQSVVAVMNKIPYIAPAGVQNAASSTPSSRVAPGSIIAIYGQSLAPSLEVGPVNPLAQTIADVTVTVNDMILPLLFVSPGQINAQVPWELGDGNYTIEIHSLGQPDVTGTFTVARNAPGLFTQTVNSQAYAIAFHEDGSLITPGSPAKPGETVGLLGTGLGPFKGQLIDGFYPPDPPPALADSVSISAGNHYPSTLWAGAAPGYTGLALIKFEVPTGASGPSLPITISVNGVKSNTVMLPVE
jgi:uncharacterized protein (TIGR03437 family)